MKTITAGMLAAIKLEVTTLVFCWKVARTDGVEFFFTDHVQDLKIDGDTYVASTGMNASSIASSDDMAVDNLEVVGALTSGAITDADLLAGKWDFASILIFQVDYKAIANGKIILRKGTIGQVSSGRTHYKAELRGMSQPLAEFFGRRVTPACDTDLGSSRCKVSLAAFTYTGSVTSVTDTYQFIVSALIGLGADWLVGGKLTFTSGNNNTLSKEIKTYNTATGEVGMFESFPYSITAADTVSATAGCDKALTTCATKFTNQLNFQGFPYLPGRGGIAKGPSSGIGPNAGGTGSTTVVVGGSGGGSGGGGLIRTQER